MVASSHIELHTLTLEELTGVVNLYPWFSAARRELCLRMARQGGDAWGEDEFSRMAMYVGDRKRIAAMLRNSSKQDLSDKDVARILKNFLSMDKEVVGSGEDRPVRVVGGDYFSQKEYDTVRTEGDSVFSKFAFKARKETAAEENPRDLSEAFYTEPLAEIFAEQGYYEQARRIYSKLILVYPEKSAYFASLIEKLENLE